MQYFCCISLKMALVLLSLLLLVQSPRISASGLLQHRKACGTYHISYLGNPDRELFYIDGNLVEKYLFCKALRIYHENHCLVTRNIGNQYCGLEFSLGLPNRAISFHTFCFLLIYLLMRCTLGKDFDIL